MRHHRLTRSAALGLALAALAAPTAAAAQQQDLRSPDTRDAARAAQSPTGSLPWAYGGPQVAQISRDLRSPDTRDAAAGRGTFSAPQVTVIKVPQPAPSAGGIDWGDAGIGAGAAIGVTLLALCSTVAIAHRRHTSQARRQTVTTG
jgi:hypothetical protein